LIELIVPVDTKLLIPGTIFPVNFLPMALRTKVVGTPVYFSRRESGMHWSNRKKSYLYLHRMCRQ